MPNQSTRPVRRMNLKKPKGRVYPLSGLLRCQCGAHMVGASAHGRTEKNYDYVCTRQQHEGGKYSCQSSRIPAEALEKAIIGRISEIDRVEAFESSRLWFEPASK